MINDEQLVTFMAEIKELQLKVGALEAIIAESPECRERYEVLLRAAEMQLLLEQQNQPSQEKLSQTKKPN